MKTLLKQNKKSSFEVNKKIIANDCYTHNEFLGKPLDKPIRKQRVGSITQAVIPKENLSLHKSQRLYDANRSNLISNSWIPELGVIFVCEVKIDKKYHYFIADGQHRANANPSDKCVCIIFKDLLPHQLFIEANDPTKCKSISWDDRFWAYYHGGDKSAKYLYNRIEEQMLTAEREKTASEGSFAGMGNIFKFMKDMKASKKKGRKTEEEKIKEEKRVNLIKSEKFDYLLDLVFSLFNAEEFKKDKSRQKSIKGYKSLWTPFYNVICKDAVWKEIPKIDKKLIRFFKKEFKNETGNVLNAESFCNYGINSVNQSTFQKDVLIKFIQVTLFRYNKRLKENNLKTNLL